MNGPLPMAATAAPEADFAEIAAALGVTERAVKKRAAKESWPYREQPGRGGKKRLFPLATLPGTVREAVQQRRIHALVAVAPAPTLPAPLAPALAAGALPAASHAAAGLLIPHEESARQRQVEWARNMLLIELSRLQDVSGCSQEAAITTLLTAARAGQLDSGKLAMLRAARDGRGRKGCDGLPSPRSIKRFIGKKKAGQRLTPAVVPPAADIKPWMLLAVALKKRPQGGCTSWIHEQIVAQWVRAWGEKPVSYDVVSHFFRHKYSQLDQLKGRYTGSQLRSHKFYRHRTHAGMLPWDEVHADGWNTHFTAPHPQTAEYVTYEVWHAHDVATRYVPPFGIGLTENFEVIAKCVENAVRAGGVMMFLQTDSTRIVKRSEKFKTNPATAIADRAGFTIVHPQTVGNSQANGIAENFNAWLDKQSRELATYQNPRQMDELSFKRGRKLTDAMVKAARNGDLVELHAKKRELEKTNKGLVLTSFEQACAWLEEKRQRWNHKPHPALPKVRCGETGRLRRQTPFEALMAHIESGWEASLPALDDAALERFFVDLFRPHVQIKVTRGTVSPYGGMRYRHAALDAWLGKEVVVAYDMVDYRQVWVKTLQGDPICIAEFVEAAGYRTLSAQEAAEEKRARARIRNKERQIEADRLRTPGPAVEAERRPAILDYLPAARAPEAVDNVRLIDLLPEKREEEKPLSYMECVAIYMRPAAGEDRDGEGEEGDGPPKEAAAG